MSPFSWLYARVLHWAAHRHAPWYLGGLSFAESSFFPIPPDVMLIPMSLARPDRALLFATITTVASVAGGVAGYLLGYFALYLVEPVIHAASYAEELVTARRWFAQWGFWVVLIAGFSPIPYKIFTIVAGAMAVGLGPFVLASFIGRGMRFYAVAALVAWGGPKVEPWLRRYVEPIGWAATAGLVVGLVVWWSW